MKEQELNTLMSVVSDPIKNVYKIESRKDLEEIQRIIRKTNTVTYRDRGFVLIRSTHCWNKYCPVSNNPVEISIYNSLFLGYFSDQFH